MSLIWDPLFFTFTATPLLLPVQYSVQEIFGRLRVPFSYLISNNKAPHPACPTPLYPVATSEGAFGFTRLFALTMFGCVRKSCKAACSCNYLRMLLCTCRFCQGLGSQILSTNKLFPVGRTLPVWLTRLTKIPACLTYSATQKSFPFSTIRRWQTSRYLWPVTFMWNHASWAENLKPYAYYLPLLLNM